MLIDDIEETAADTVLEALDALAALELTPDMLLQASRRVDWRFLLPNPALGRVAYVGPVDSEHAASLRLFLPNLYCHPARLVARGIPPGQRII